MTFFIIHQLYLINKAIGLRVPLKDEILGADYSEHGIVEGRLSKEGNHVYGRHCDDDDLDEATMELSPKMKRQAENIRQRKISRMSALSTMKDLAPFNDHMLLSRQLSEESEESQESAHVDCLVENTFLAFGASSSTATTTKSASMTSLQSLVEETSFSLNTNRISRKAYSS